MHSLRLPHAEGKLHVVAPTSELLEAGARVAAELDVRARVDAAPRDVGGHDAILKAAPLAAAGARRHGLRFLLGAPPPRVTELHHLAWLRARLFRAPAPLFASFVRRSGHVVHQALATARVAGARPFADHARDHADDLEELVRELGRELGRLHALGFLHADLYPRNVLVAPPEGGAGGGRRLVLLDCWAGGPGRRDGRGRRVAARGLARDLGTWLVDGATLRDRSAQRAWIAAYLGARAAGGRPVAHLDRFLAAAARARRADLRRLERQRGRLRGGAFPPAGWDPAGLRIAGAEPGGYQNPASASSAAR